MKLPKIKSNKQLYRLWFEFLKMAHDEPNTQGELAKSADLYAPWGDVRDKPFDPWWEQHKHLFGQTYVTEIEKISLAENVMHVAIPLNQPASRSIAEVRDLIESRQKAMLIERGIDPASVKSLSNGFGKFNFTQGVEIRGRVLYDIQLMYGFWQKMGKPAVNSDYVTEVVLQLRSRPRSKWIPYLLQIEPMTDKKGNLRYDEGQIRQVRRYLKKGYSVCCAVANGEFPGETTL